MKAGLADSPDVVPHFDLRRVMDSNGARLGLAVAVAVGSALGASPAYAQGNVSWAFPNTGIESTTAAWSQTGNAANFTDVYGNSGALVYAGSASGSYPYTVELKRQNWILPDIGMGEVVLQPGGSVGRITGQMPDDWYYLKLAAVNGNYSSTKTVSASGHVQWCNPGC